jgi:hypothetical protein
MDRHVSLCMYEISFQAHFQVMLRSFDASRILKRHHFLSISRRHFPQHKAYQSPVSCNFWLIFSKLLSWQMIKGNLGANTVIMYAYFMVELILHTNTAEILEKYSLLLRATLQFHFVILRVRCDVQKYSSIFSVYCIGSN